MTEHHQVVRPEPVPAARDASEPMAPPAPTLPAVAQAPPRSRRSRRWWLAMTGSIAGFGLLAALVTLGPLSYTMLTQKDAVLATPQQAAGLTLDTTERATSAADDLRSVFTAAFTMSTSVAAVYGDPHSAARSVLFVGGTGFLAKPERELTQLFSLLDDQAGHVTGVRDVDPGPLDGTMRCGTVTSTDGAPMTVCGWADYGSLAMAMLPERDIDESARLMRELRTAIQHR
jgi:hypothetical protein